MAALVALMGLAACASTSPYGTAGVNVGSGGVSGRVGAGTTIGSNVNVGVNVGL